MSDDRNHEQSPAAGQGNREIFLSYARADGRTFAEDLHKRLEALGYAVWQDILDMQGGNEWWPQIEVRIKQAKAVVLVVTPAALASGDVRSEWVNARSVGTPILPVTTEPSIFETAPRWMQKVDVFILSPVHPDYDKTWARFISQLEQLPPRQPVPFIAPPLPSHFTGRERELRSITERFLDTNRANPCFATVVVHATPGFGKTTLAQAVCYDPDIIEAFTGGILWAALGENGEGVLPGLSAMVSALSGSRATFDTPEEAAAELDRLLKSRDCLMVLDDVWDRAHVTPFLQSEQCAWLITTRDPENCVLEESILVPVKEMRPAEAAQMLLNFLPPPALKEKCAVDVSKALRLLAKRLGEWPLLLNIFGGTLRSEISVRKQSLEGALDLVYQGLDAAGLTAFDRNRSQDRNAALAKSMSISLNRYTDEQKQHLYELSIFRPAEAIPQEVALRLWEAAAGMSRFDAKQLLRSFGGTFFELSFERALGSVVLRFHRALREVLANRLPPDCKRTLHLLLLASYNPGGKPWTSIEDDGYLYNHLSFHLVESQQVDILDTLLWQESSGGKNAWYEICSRLGRTGGFREDIDRAWRARGVGGLAGPGRGEPAGNLLLAARCAMLTATQVSLSNLMPPELIESLLRDGVWTPAQALDRAGQMSDPKKRLEAVKRLAVHLPPPLRSEAERIMVGSALDIEEGKARLQTLVELAPGLRETLSQEAAGTALDEVLQLGNQRSKSSALVKLAPYLPTILLPKALEAASTISTVGERAQALFAVSRRLPGKERLRQYREILSIAPEISVPLTCSKVLIGLAPHLPPGLLVQAVETARFINSPLRRAETLMDLAPYLPGAEHRELIREIGESMRQVQPVAKQTSLGKEICPKILELGYPDEAVEAARSLENPAGRARASITLLPLLPEAGRQSIREAVLADAAAIASAQPQHDVLVQLTPHLSASELNRALEIARTIQVSWRQDEALKTIKDRLSNLQGETGGTPAPVEEDLTGLVASAAGAPGSPGPGPAKGAGSGPGEGTGTPQSSVRESLQKVQEIGDSRALIHLGLALAPHLPDSLISELLEVVLAYQWLPFEYDEVLAQLAPYLSENQAQRVADGIFDNETCAELALPAIAALSPALPGETLRWALKFAVDLAYSIPDGREYSKSFPILCFVEMAYQRKDRDAMAMWERTRAAALKYLAPQISGSNHIRTALKAISKFKDPIYRVKVLAALAPYLPERQRLTAAAGALKAASASGPRHLRVCLSKLAPHFCGDLLKDTLAEIRQMKNAKDRCLGYLALAPYRHGDSQAEVLDAARELKGYKSYLAVLIKLAPHVPESFRAEIVADEIAAAEASGSESRLQLTLRTLAAFLPESRQWEVLHTTENMGNIPELIYLLPQLADAPRREGLARALEGLGSVEKLSTRAACLEMLKPLLQEISTSGIYAIWRETLEYLAALGRFDLLVGLRWLTPFAVALGGEESAAQLFEAALTVRKWWH